MTLVRLAADAKRKKKVPPKFWRVLNNGFTDPRWAGRICRFVERDREDGRTYITVEWVNGERFVFQKGKEVVRAAIQDRLAYLAKLDEWEKIQKAKRRFERSCDWQNQHITKGEVVEVPGLEERAWRSNERDRTLDDALDAWAEGVPVWDGSWPPDAEYLKMDDYVHGRLIFTAREWEKEHGWQQAVVIAPAVDIGKSFTVQLAGSALLDRGVAFNGRVMRVGWLNVRRLEPTPKRPKRDA